MTYTSPVVGSGMGLAPLLPTTAWLGSVIHGSSADIPTLPPSPHLIRHLLQQRCQHMQRPQLHERPLIVRIVGNVLQTPIQVHKGLRSGRMEEQEVTQAHGADEGPSALY